MVKAIVQDVVPPRRSVRQIVVPNVGRPETTDRLQAQAFGPPNHEQSGGRESPRRRFRASKSVWFILFGAVIFLYVILAALFVGAKVTITPRHENIVINGSFTAKQKPGALELPFETVLVTAEKTITVPATGEKYLEQKASGIITIYNDYGPTPLRLVKNTRFEAPGGLMYRIANTVTVPPQQIKNGAKKPGTIDIEVYSDSAGAEYNVESALFTIPGLKGSPQFSGFYAKTKTAIAGGFEGTAKIIDPTKEKEARTTLKTQLVQEASVRASQELPPGFRLLDTMVYADYLSLPNAGTQSADTVLVGEKITFHAVIFNESALATYIAENTVPNFNARESVYIADWNNLQFVLLNKETIKPWEAEAIQLTITGNAPITWNVDTEKLQKDLVAKPKKEINTVLGSYPGVVKAAVTIRPFWKKTFPKNAARIVIEKTINQNNPNQREGMKASTSTPEGRRG